jgi:hypothetical protein
MDPGVRRGDDGLVIPANAEISSGNRRWMDRVGPGVRRDDSAGGSEAYAVTRID